MRVLLVSNLYPPYWIGGYEQIAGWVASGLRERGHEVCVLTGRGAAFAEHSEVEPGLDLDLAALCADSRNGGIAFPGDARAAFRRHVFHAGHYRTAKSLIARFRPDLVSFWNPAFITYSPLLAARMAGIPSVAHVSDASSNVFRGVAPPACPPMLRGLARGAVDGLFSLASPARIVVPSEFLKRRLLSEGIGSGRVSVLPWPGGIASRSDEAPRTRPCRRFLYVGRLAPEKGLAVLLDAFRTLAGRRSDVSLTLVGEGTAAFASDLRERAAGLPVRFAGRLVPEAVSGEYRRHEALVFPSVWDEPFAVVPLEAMALGLPVVASASGGTPEAVEHESSGVLVPPNDPEALAAAMLRLVDEPELATRLSAGALARARERYAYAPFLARLTVLYEEARHVGKVAS